MNVKEGARRMRVAGRWIFLVPLSAGVLLVAISLAMSYIARTSGLGLMDLGFLLVFPCVPGAMLWLGGWILEGFTKTSS